MATNTKDFVVRYGVRGTNFNNVAITAPASLSTFTLGSGKTFTVSNTLTFTGTDSSSVAFGAGGTVAYTGGKLSQFSATTSSELAGVISDETGSGSLVFATSPTLVTPVLGVATATSINKVAITAPATSATLTIADGKTLTVSNTLTFTGTDASSVAFGTGGTVAYTSGKLSQFAATTSSELAGVISDETGSGALVFGTSPTFTTSVIAGSATMAVFNTTATTVNAFGAATTLSIGASTGTTTVNNSMVVTGDLTVNGTTTTINSTVTTVDDITFELGSVASPTDTTANGGGIVLKGATDKTILWDSANGNWTSNQDWNIPTGKVFKINNASVLSATALGTGVVTSSLTTVGTIGTGTWQGTVISGQYGGTGVNNSGKTITLGGNLTTSGAFATTLTVTNTTSVTLPTSGTLIGSNDSGTITTAMLANSTNTTTGVTYAKIQYVSTNNRVLGRISSGTGVVEELTADNLVSIINTATTAVTVAPGTASYTKDIAVTANSTGYVFDSFVTGTYTSVEYFIQMKQATGTKMTTTRLIVTWDGTNYNWTEYAMVDGTTAVTYTGFNVVANTTNTDVSVLSTDGNTNNIVMKVQATYLKA